jgi:hypothetical protein
VEKYWIRAFQPEMGGRSDCRHKVEKDLGFLVEIQESAIYSLMPLKR